MLSPAAQQMNSPGTCMAIALLVLQRPCERLGLNPLSWRPYCGYGHDFQPVHTAVADCDAAIANMGRPAVINRER